MLGKPINIVGKYTSFLLHKKYIIDEVLLFTTGMGNGVEEIILNLILADLLELVTLLICK